MNDKMNENKQLIHEHIRCERLIDDLERRAVVHRAQLNAIEAEKQTIERRQDQIADELGPILCGGPIEFWNGSTKCVVRLENGGILSIEELRPASTFAIPIQPRMFSDAELTEAARHQAFGDVFSNLDDDDTTEIISLPGRRATIVGNAG